MTPVRLKTAALRSQLCLQREKHRTDTNETAQPHTIAGHLNIQIKLLEEYDLCSENKCLVTAHLHDFCRI